MYALFLTVHSWVRWGLVLVAAALFVRSVFALRRGRAYSDVDKRVAKGFAGLLYLQLALGLTLYVLLSPLVRAGLSDLGAAMASSSVRFWVIEHQLAALIAIGIGHVGLARAGKATDDRGRHRSILWGAGGCLLMILIAIPWPALPYGRALFHF
jgi:hypothetical protein